MSENILIVGGTGTVGKALLGILLDKGMRPRVLLRQSSNLPDAIQDKVDIVRGDLANRDSLQNALAGITRVFLLSRDHPQQAELEENLVQIAEHNTVKLLIKSSAFAAALQPPVGYGINHARVEQKLMKSSMNWIILRPYVFMQNFLELADLITEKGIMPLPFGSAHVAFVDARDVALAAATLLLEDSPGSGIYQLTGPESLSLDDCAKILSEGLGRTLKYRSPPFWLAAVMMRMQGVSSWDVKMRKQLFNMVKNGGEAATTVDFETICGLKPRNLENFVKDYRQQFLPG